jgi:Soluble NSF attachment protein, SNAP
MSGYKKNAMVNRDALFGGGGGGGNSSSSSKSRASAPITAKPAATMTGEVATNTARGYKGATTTTGMKVMKRGPTLSAEARLAKQKEAEEYRDKANQCMKSGLFKAADPVAACTYFKRAADCYQVLDDTKLERLYRLESAQCNMICKAFVSAASDYTRAADLLVLEIEENTVDSDLQMQWRRDAAGWHQKAAEAWTQGNEMAKAAGSKVNAACVLHGGDHSSARRLSKEALASMEEAIEAHVPDPLNPYARYRQTGCSAFVDPDSDETVETVSAETLAMARAHLVTRAYSNEPIQKLLHLLTGYGEYASALYAAGAVTAVLKAEGMATISLSRAYVTETILTLAMGDPVLAEQQFLQRHCQDTFYLSSRECQFAEELFRAVKTRDLDALNEARDVTGRNKTALANLSHDVLRNVVQELRIAGVARMQQALSAAVPSAEVPLTDLLNQKTGYETAFGVGLDSEALAAELDELNFDGLDSDNDDIGDVGDANDELDALEDDDIDLR